MSDGSQLPYLFQIKNTISNAQSIALETQSPLSVEHVDTVLEVVNDWNKAKEQVTFF
jgi:hypothetical protein